jgi:hypothetical protein
MKQATKKNLILGGALLLSCVGVVGAASAATDWKSMPGTACTQEWGGLYCPIPREYFNRTAGAAAFTGFTVEVEGSGAGLNCTIFSNPADMPFYWWQQGVNKSRTDSGAISFTAAELATLGYYNNGLYLLQCGNVNYVRSYRWTEQGNQG